MSGGSAPRRPIVGVMGGGRASKETLSMARELGGRIAAKAWILLNGGRNAGVMAASACGAAEAGGLTIGILPDSDTLRSHLYNLRKTIDKPFPRPLLHTIQNTGYRLYDAEDR